jgi:holo-[acyl-carrier protein] synthase
MKLSSGVDLIEIERVRDVIARHGDQFLDRIFTDAELQACGGRVESLAARFTAKEAVAKALGTGIGDVGWKDIEVVGDENRAPSVRLSGEADRVAKKKELAIWSLSLSHTHTHAIAFVIAMGQK